MKKKILGLVALMATMSLVSNAQNLTLEERVARLESETSISDGGTNSMTFFNDFEFHGYARAGLFVNESGDDGGVNSIGMSKNRLGNESKFYWEAELVKGFDIGEDSWAKFHFMLAGGDDEYRHYSNYTDDLSKSGDINTPNVFVEAGGLLGNGETFGDSVVWIGKRFNAREDIHITDYYYRDYSGTGLGIENVKLGNGKLDVSLVANDSYDGDVYTTSVDSNGDIIIGREDNPYNSYSNDDSNVYTLHGQYATGNWNFEGAVAKYGNDLHNDVADFGAGIGIDYSLPGFYGSKAGWSKIITDFGYGLQTGDSLGYANSVSGSDHRDDAWSARIITTGQASFENFHIMPQLVYQHDENFAVDNGRRDWISLAVRPVVPVNKHFAWQFGAAYDHKFFNDELGDADGGLFSLTVAPTLKIDTSNFWGRPELRLFANYNQYTGDYDTASSDGDDDGFNFGAQAEVWF